MPPARQFQIGLKFGVILIRLLRQHHLLPGFRIGLFVQDNPALQIPGLAQIGRQAVHMHLQCLAAAPASGALLAHQQIAAAPDALRQGLVNCRLRNSRSFSSWTLASHFSGLF
ncbi:hypothetical protein PhaeoP97_00954 [Phaeobacter porticola]|uniref:Uncharacterized protein n=1 Tax=Phaeobacter porticola TaxID=1844006 RepID=A0A1L3I2Q0_9RHOB|nr:hypothetical protein PhaeoP97_00954 [Phaeobacter porticola]